VDEEEDPEEEQARSQRRPSSTWASTSTPRFGSSSPVEEKVRLSFGDFAGGSGVDPKGGLFDLFSFSSWTSSCFSLADETPTILAGTGCFESTVIGTLKGFDQLLNLVLDDVEEEVLGAFRLLPLLLPLPLDLDLPSLLGFLTLPTLGLVSVDTVPVKRTRTLGLTVLRGPTIVLISPVDGSEGASSLYSSSPLQSTPF
jgi:small nuclear ribonucleoprotein (snRNP)-like protein